MCGAGNPSAPLSLAVVTHICLSGDLLEHKQQHISDYITKENDALSPRNHELIIVPQRGLGTQEPLPMHVRMLTSPFLYGFVQVTRAVRRSWVQLSCLPRRPCFIAIFPIRWLLCSFSPLFCDIPQVYTDI